MTCVDLGTATLVLGRLEAEGFHPTPLGPTLKSMEGDLKFSVEVPHDEVVGAREFLIALGLKKWLA